jgi:AbrB family looped-hinge helix DNA binding protein
MSHDLRIAAAGPERPVDILKRHLDALPSEQLRKAFEDLPSERLRKALDDLPGGQLKRTLEQMDVPLPSTKSDKIRLLAAAGYATADIARSLGIRYQHAYNVLSADRAQSGAGDAAPAPVTATIGASGRFVIPAELRERLAISEGEEVSLSIEDGALVMRTRAGELARARAIVRQYVPEGVSLVDELIADRHADAAREGV